MFSVLVTSINSVLGIDYVFSIFLVVQMNGWDKEGIFTKRASKEVVNYYLAFAVFGTSWLFISDYMNYMIFTNILSPVFLSIHFPLDENYPCHPDSGAKEQ